MKEFLTQSFDETLELGVLLGNLLQPGDVVAVNGNLGTGKTALTAGIAKALHIEGYITSPTFTIVNEYKGKIPLFHFDAYRITDPEEMFEIGFEEYLTGNGIVVIEWAEQIEAVLPKERIEIEILKDLAQGIDHRIIKIGFIGERFIGYEEKLT